MDYAQTNGKAPNKNVVCRYFANSGFCFYGENCQFIHVMGEKDTAQQDDKMISVPSSGNSAALLPGVANVPSQLKSTHPNGYSSLPQSPQRSFTSSPSNENFSKQFQSMRTTDPDLSPPHGYNSAGNSPYYKQQHQSSNHPPRHSSAVRSLAFHTPASQNHTNVGIHMEQSEKTSFFMSQQIRAELQRQQSIRLAQDPTLENGLPEAIDNYRQLYPIKHQQQKQRQPFAAFQTSCYKAVNSKDGVTYFLKRVHGVRNFNPKAVSLIDQWKKVQHSNIVPLKEVFTTKAFGDTSLVFVYQFHPGADTIMARHLKSAVNERRNHDNFGSQTTFHNRANNNNSFLSNNGGIIPERLLWSYIIQLTGAVRVIHSLGLACRCLDSTKVLLIGNSRLRLSCLGILGVINYDDRITSAAVVSQDQQDDLLALGELILSLACYSLDSIRREQMMQSLEFVKRNYTSDLHQLIYQLLNGRRLPNNQAPRSINDVMPIIGARFYSQLDATQSRADVLERELGKEMENGRLLRILSKLCTIMERPEFEMDTEWSETGDRYLLKLFRDYLFHQVTESGSPWLDFAHVVTCLNKLDSGVEERICLSSRDQMSVLVVPYRDLKACLETAYSELLGVENSAT